MSAIGDLVATMGLNIAPWQTGVTAATGSLRKFASTTQSTLTKIRGGFSSIAGSLGLGLSVAGLAAMTKANLDMMDSTGKLADRLGMTTERLMGLRHAADIAGGGAEALDTALEKMTRYVGEAALGMKENRDTLDRLGLSMKALLSMNPDDRFAAIAEGIRKLGTEEERTAVAMRIFGRGASELINTLALGADGLAEMQAEAEKLGLTFDRDAAARAEEANDALTRLGATIKGSLLEGTADLADQIKSVADWLAKLPQLARDARAKLLDFAKPGSVEEDLMTVVTNPLGAPAALKRLISGEQRERTDEEINLSKRISEEQLRLRAGKPLAVPTSEEYAAKAAARAKQEADARMVVIGDAMQEHVTGPAVAWFNRVTGSAGKGVTTAISDTTAAVKDRQAMVKRSRELAEMVETPQEEFARRMIELNTLHDAKYLGLSAMSDETYQRLADQYKQDMAERQGETAGTALGESELPRALERGSDEAWSKIVSAFYSDQGDAAEETAENTRRTADALERLESQQPVVEFEIGA